MNWKPPVKGLDPTVARVASTVTYTDQSLVDVTGLTLPLLANAVYEFEANLSVASSEATNGCKYGVQFSGAGASVEAQIQGTLAAASCQSERISALNTASSALVKSANAGGIRIHGVLTTGANAGNLTIQHLKVSSGTSTVYAESFLKAKRIG